MGDVGSVRGSSSQDIGARACPGGPVAIASPIERLAISSLCTSLSSACTSPPLSRSLISSCANVSAGRVSFDKRRRGGDEARLTACPPGDCSVPLPHWCVPARNRAVANRFDEPAAGFDTGSTVATMRAGMPAFSSFRREKLEVNAHIP
eukprot:scaffold181434_cov31-Tisochrysis_lutea.AAC.2